MRILLDENMPEAVGPLLGGHDYDHVVRLGWAGVKNGNLLSLAEAKGFDLLLTLDKGFAHQQNLGNRKISIIVLRPDGQGLSSILPLMEKTVSMADQLGSGKVAVVSNRRE